MSNEKPTPGSVGWLDLTIDDADQIRRFYEQVVGWRSEGVDMGQYSDFNMKSGDGDTVAGICHARGENQGMPAQWLVYINVVDLDASIAACKALGGSVLVEPRQMGGGRCAVIKDPAGACSALFQSG